MPLISLVLICLLKMKLKKLEPFYTIDVIDGSWGDWSRFSACSAQCGPGIQIRMRECNDPPPANGGMDCIGSSVDIKACNQGPCAGEWKLAGFPKEQ